MSDGRRASQTEVNDAITGQGVISVPAGKAPQELAKAAALTQAAIEGLGGPVYASMTDHKPVDGAMVKAMTDIAINKQGVIAVPEGKAPVDRAIAEALTKRAIEAGKTKEGLKKTETKSTEVDLAALQAAAQAEKDAKVAARTFGGGDAKAGMPNILKEIEGQGGVIAVPSDKAPEANVTLNHAKTLMEIGALKGEPIYASGTDHKAEDKGLAQAKILIQIGTKGETSANPEKVAKVEAKAAEEALTIMAISSGKRDSLKSVDKPAEGLSKEQLADLQKAAAEEKA